MSLIPELVEFKKERDMLSTSKQDIVSMVRIRFKLDYAVLKCSKLDAKLVKNDRIIIKNKIFSLILSFSYKCLKFFFPFFDLIPVIPCQENKWVAFHLVEQYPSSFNLNWIAGFVLRICNVIFFHLCCKFVLMFSFWWLFDCLKYYAYFSLKQINYFITFHSVTNKTIYLLVYLKLLIWFRFCMSLETNLLMI